MTLNVQAVAQAQWPEVILRELTGEISPRLIAKLVDALGDQRLIDVVVAVHSDRIYGVAPAALNTRWFGGAALAVMSRMPQRRRC